MRRAGFMSLLDDLATTKQRRETVGRLRLGCWSSRPTVSSPISGLQGDSSALAIPLSGACSLLMRGKLGVQGQSIL